MRDKLIEILKSVKRQQFVMDGETLGGQSLIQSWVAERLADALIKNGITIPTFKVGDIVWVYDFMWGIIPCEVDHPYHCRAGKEGGCTFEMSFTEKDIGDVVFATREEAVRRRGVSRCY